jgi:hypothetical protein
VNTTKREGKHETERGAKERIFGRGTEKRTKIERRRVLQKKWNLKKREIYQRRHYSSPPDVFFNVVFCVSTKAILSSSSSSRSRGAFSSGGELTRGGVSLSLFFFFLERA